MLTVALTISSTVQQAASILTQLFGLAALAGVLGGGLAVGYRWYTGSRVPQWLAVLVGTAGVALYLGTTAALEEVIRSDVQPTEVEIVLFNLTALLAGGGGAALGSVVSDRFSTDVLLWSPTQDADDVSRLAQTVGRVTTVQLPTAIDDASGYDPVPERTKERLAGKRLVFPRGLTVDELDGRLTERLKSDYGVGTVDIEFDDSATVTHLAVGTRAAGIGSTLPPATNALAVRADPGFSASTGDIVQLWTRSPPRRVLTGELRGVADDVVTIAVDAGDTPRVDPTQRYRLVTLPVNDRPDREFASLLRAAEETFSSVTVEAGSPLHGLPVGALDLTITAIRPEDGEPVPFPEPTYRLAPGDLLFVIARPAGLRRLERGAEPLDPSLASSSLPADDSQPVEGITTADEAETEREKPTGEGGLPASHDGSEDGSVADITDDDSEIAGKADADSFDEIKAQFEATDSQEAAEDEGQETEDEPIEAIAEDSQGSTEVSADSDARSEPSFDELKSEFDSGDADWGEGTTESGDERTETAESADDETETTESPDEETGEPDVEVAFEDESGSGRDEKSADESTDPDDDGLVSLEEADITFEDEQATEPDESDATDSSGTLGDLDIDDDLQGDEGDSVSDDIGNLEFEEDEDSEEFGELGFEDDEDPFEAVEDDEDETESDGDDQDEDNDEEDSGSSGGGSSFADLKAEFESGDADWEEDISDSPGGDMRLDE